MMHSMDDDQEPEFANLIIEDLEVHPDKLEGQLIEEERPDKREFTKESDGQWYCDDKPVTVDLGFVGITDLSQAQTPISIVIRQDDEDEVLVKIEEGVIKQALVNSSGLVIDLKSFKIADDSYAAKFFLTGTAQEKAEQKLKWKDDTDLDLHMGYIPVDYDDPDDDEPELV